MSKKTKSLQSRKNTQSRDNASLPFLTPSPNGITLRLKVQPGASRNQVLGEENGLLKIKLQAPPVAGAANRALIRFLSKAFRVPKQNIQIRRGEKSRIKVVEILGLSLKDCLTVVSSPH